jgi:hypothetical protein
MTFYNAPLPPDTNGVSGGVVVTSIAYLTYDAAQTSITFHFSGTTTTLAISTNARVAPLLTSINALISSNAYLFVVIPPDSSGATGLINLNAITFFTYAADLSSLTLSFALAPTLTISTSARVSALLPILTGKSGFGDNGFGDVGYGD